MYLVVTVLYVIGLIGLLAKTDLAGANFKYCNFEILRSHWSELQRMRRLRDHFFSLDAFFCSQTCSFLLFFLFLFQLFLVFIVLVPIQSYFSLFLPSFSSSRSRSCCHCCYGCCQFAAKAA